MTGGNSSLDGSVVGKLNLSFSSVILSGVPGWWIKVDDEIGDALTDDCSSSLSTTLGCDSEGLEASCGAEDASGEEGRSWKRDLSARRRLGREAPGFFTLAVDDDADDEELEPSESLTVVLTFSGRGGEACFSVTFTGVNEGVGLRELLDCTREAETDLRGMRGRGAPAELAFRGLVFDEWVTGIVEDWTASVAIMDDKNRTNGLRGSGRKVVLGVWIRIKR